MNENFFTMTLSMLGGHDAQFNVLQSISWVD